MSRHLDLSYSFDWIDGLPRPQWDVIEAWVNSQIAAGDRKKAWSEIASQWLLRLAEALAPEYELDSSENCLLLSTLEDGAPELLLRLMESSRRALLSILAGVADFRSPGKIVAIVLPNSKAYYTYVSPFYGDGEYGGTAGLHVRQGYPHVVACGRQLSIVQNTIAHEMTHAALAHLSLPLWLEEGLTQMFEQDMTGRQPLLLDGKMAERHRRYWVKNGLNAFWYGMGFSQPGNVQELCYQLSEVLLRLLAGEHRPRWFGLDRSPQRRLLAFLGQADAGDCGQAAAEEYLCMDLSSLAARFLGPGDWQPQPEMYGDATCSGEY